MKLRLWRPLPWVALYFLPMVQKIRHKVWKHGTKSWWRQFPRTIELWLIKIICKI